MALGNLRRSLALAPGGWLPHFHAGNIYAAQGDVDAAARSFAAAIARNPYYVDALQQLARLADRRGESGRAAQLRARAAEVTTGSVRP